MQIEWNREALEELRRLDPQVARRILKRLTWFAQNFDRVIPEPLGGELQGLYKLPSIRHRKVAFSFPKQSQRFLAALRLGMTNEECHCEVVFSSPKQSLSPKRRDSSPLRGSE